MTRKRQLKEDALRYREIYLSAHKRRLAAEDTINRVVYLCNSGAMSPRSAELVLAVISLHDRDAAHGEELKSS